MRGVPIIQIYWVYFCQVLNKISLWSRVTSLTQSAAKFGADETRHSTSRLDVRIYMNREDERTLA